MSDFCLKNHVHEDDPLIQDVSGWTLAALYSPCVAIVVIVVIVVNLQRHLTGNISKSCKRQGDLFNVSTANVAKRGRCTCFCFLPFDLNRLQSDSLPALAPLQLHDVTSSLPK